MAGESDSYNSGEAAAFAASGDTPEEVFVPLIEHHDGRLPAGFQPLGEWQGAVLKDHAGDKRGNGPVIQLYRSCGQ